MLSVSCHAMWTESRNSPAKSGQLADRSPSSRGVQWRNLFNHKQQSTACLHLRGVQRRCVWAVGRLSVAAWLACVAAAVDRQARKSCLVWCGVVNWPPDKCVLRRSASGGRTAPPDALRHKPDTERTCLAVGPTQFTPPHQTRQNSPARLICSASKCCILISTFIMLWFSFSEWSKISVFCSDISEVLLLSQQGSHRPQTPPRMLPPGGGYFKHTSFSCRYVRRNIMCMIINIQHAHCGLVGSDCKQ